MLSSITCPPCCQQMGVGNSVEGCLPGLLPSEEGGQYLPGLLLAQNSVHAVHRGGLPVSALILANHGCVLHAEQMTAGACPVCR